MSYCYLVFFSLRLIPSFWLSNLSIYHANGTDIENSWNVDKIALYSALLSTFTASQLSGNLQINILLFYDAVDFGYVRLYDDRTKLREKKPELLCDLSILSKKSKEAIAMIDCPNKSVKTMTVVKGGIANLLVPVVFGLFMEKTIDEGKCRCDS